MPKPLCLAPTQVIRYTNMRYFVVKEMEVLSFLTGIIYLLNIGIFSTLIARFSGANMSILVFCALLYCGTKPLETLGIMLTYLVFMRLAIYTQKNRLDLKQRVTLKGWKMYVVIAVILGLLFVYPFASLAIFLLAFMVEALIQMRAKMPKERLMSAREIAPYSIGGAVIMIICMLLISRFPEQYYYIFGGIVALLICAFFWWLSTDRDKMARQWDKILMLSFIPAGLLGFDLADWLEDMRRSIHYSKVAYNIPAIMLPAFFIAFVAFNLLFGIFPLSGLFLALFAAVGLRLFGYYEMSGRGRGNVVALGITVLAVALLLLVEPEPTGLSQYVDAIMPNANMGFHGLLSMF